MEVVADPLFELPIRMKYMRTATVQSDYWHVWVKSGLLEYIGEKLRGKYKTPILNMAEDLGFGEITIGDESASDDYHIFFDSWDRKAEFSRELSEYVDQLHLCRSAFWEVFDFIFYNDPFNINREWTGIDTEAWYYPLGMSDEYELRLVGHTRDEARDVVKTIKSNLKRYGVKVTKEMNKALVGYGKSIQRKIRQIKNKELYVAVIEQLKFYKSNLETDGEDIKRFEDEKVRNRHISELCASRIARDLELNDFTSVAFRSLSARLYQEFPILKEYISLFK